MVTPVPVIAMTMAYAELRPFSRAEHFMSMPALRRHTWTVDEVDRLLDEREGLYPAYELIDGELLVTPAPTSRHQRVVIELLVLLREYVVANRLGELRFGRAGLTHDTRLEPDLFVVPSIDGRRPRADDSILIDASLVIEVLSPSSLRHDRFTKRRFFQHRGVPVYWVVDPDGEAIETWRPGDERPEVSDERVTWRPEGAKTPFELDVRQFFAGVADLD